MQEGQARSPDRSGHGTVNGEGHPDGANHAGDEPERRGEDSLSPRRRRLRNALLAAGGVVAMLFAAAVWLALDPGLLRAAAEYVATAATGRPVLIGSLDLRTVDGRAVIEAREVRVGRTTTERVSISLAGWRSHASGDGVRFPNGGTVDHFRASIDFSLTALPKIPTVEATGAGLVAARRARSGSDRPPPLARLLAVSRLFLRFGLERLVLHSGEIEYRGRSSTRSAGLTAILDATGEGLAFSGELLVGSGVPPLAFDGTVRDPLADDWRIDTRLTGERVPMAGVRFLAGVLEPGPTMRTTLDRISSETRFRLSVRVTRARIEWATLDFTFGAPEASEAEEIRLDGVRFIARAEPDPAGWTVTGDVDWTRLPGGEDAERSEFALRWSAGVPGSLRWSAHRVPVPLLAGVARNALPTGHSFRSALERLEPTGVIDEVAAFGDPGSGGEPSFWLSAVVSGFGATAWDWRITEAGARIEFAGGQWRARFAGDRLQALAPSFRSSPYDLTLQGEVRVAPTERGWMAQTAGLDFAVAGIGGRIEGSLVVPLPNREGAPSVDAEIRLDDPVLADIGAILPDRRAVAFTRWYRRAVRSGRLSGAMVKIRGDPRGIPFPAGDGEFEARGTVREVDFAYAEGWPAVLVEEAAVRANGARLEFSGIRGTILDTRVEHGTAWLPDATDPAGRIRVSIAGSGPARDLLEFVRASPLGTRIGGVASGLRADGPTSTAAELDIPYGRRAGSRRLEVAGTIALDGVAVGIAGRRAVLEEVRGDLAFDAASLSGGPLHGRFQGAGIESHVEFERGEGLVLRFSGEGDGRWFGTAIEDLVDLGKDETEPWLAHLLGRVSWDAEYRSRSGIVFRSDLRSAAVDFPPPFEKPAGTARRLEVVLTPGEAEWLIDASYGPDAKGTFEIAETDGEWALARGAVSLGASRPVLPAEAHVLISGDLAEIDLDPWLALGTAEAAGRAGWLSRIGRISLATAGARVLGRRVALDHLDLAPAAGGSGYRVRIEGAGAEGEIAFPADPSSGSARARLERLHFEEPFATGEDHEGEVPGEGAGADARPEQWPSFDARIGSLRFGKLDLGTVRATGSRVENGLHVEEARGDSPDLRIRGRGQWLTGEDGAPASRFEATLDTGDLARLLAAAGLGEEAAEGGTVEVRFDLAWPGSPFEPSPEKLAGTIENGRREREPSTRTRRTGRPAVRAPEPRRPAASPCPRPVPRGRQGLRIRSHHGPDPDRGRIGPDRRTGDRRSERSDRSERQHRPGIPAVRSGGHGHSAPHPERRAASGLGRRVAGPRREFPVREGRGGRDHPRSPLPAAVPDPRTTERSGDRAHPAPQPYRTEMNPPVPTIDPGERVVVGLSGGVDSAVTAAMLRDAGAAVEPVFMKNWEEDDHGGECSAAQDLLEAEAVCAHLGLRLRPVNFSTEYWDRVFEPFLAASAAGRTPNPDVWCNQEIKFGELFRYADDLGVSRVATGHYARVVRRESRYRLLKGRDAQKDQSYFLYRVSQDSLARALFPVGDRTKPEVRAAAAAAGLPNHARPDSTGICFIGERPFREFLARWIPPAPGPIETVEGERLGTHGGLAFHTLGQRRGLGIGGRRGGSGEPWYVAGKDFGRNALIVAQGARHPKLAARALTAGNPSWTAGEPPPFPLVCEAVTRYRGPGSRSRVTTLGKDRLRIAFDPPQWGVAPGQSVVLYAGEECLGGAIIEETESG